MKILIFDDHEAIQHFIKQQITDILPNVEILLCSHLECAKNTISSHPSPDFAICDLEIKSGANITIPELCFKKNIPCMVYSSHVNSVLISELRELNICCYVSKTSGINYLKTGLECLLSNKQYFCPMVNDTMDAKTVHKVTEKLFLSKGQKTVLEVMAKGFNRDETSTILKLKKSTINNHIARAREINDCENFDELIRRYRFWDMLE